MKFSTAEEYGIRFLLRIAKADPEKSLTITEISRLEGISVHNTAKILRMLRLAGFLESVRGQDGGYKLTRAPEQIKISDVISSLGGKFYEDNFCSIHSGEYDICSNHIDCSLKNLWKTIQDTVDSVLEKVTLHDLTKSQTFYNIEISQN